MLQETGDKCVLNSELEKEIRHKLKTAMEEIHRSVQNTGYTDEQLHRLIKNTARSMLYE